MKANFRVRNPGVGLFFWGLGSAFLKIELDSFGLEIFKWSDQD